MEDAKKAAVDKHDGMSGGGPPKEGTSSFKLETGIIPVGRDGRYPYPATENWQKAIGAHQIWLELDVTVEVTREQTDPPGVASGSAPVCTPQGDTVVTYLRTFDVDMTLHMEDMYNFNPGMADIATGTPDAENGRFEVTGLGQEYVNFSNLERSFTFDASQVGANPGTTTSVNPDRTPRTARAEDSRPFPTTR